ncbi:hypothetical protein RJ640_018231 [Escallonia rubra]|uniref:Uncharacterized protein n=1 Tax=Escallonia rubra TaxID=112253 RepID=A0AA88QLU5_9ASTE|nr:hypothetical protein RJ640_018231 [Escallonia rubra]
MFRSSGTCLNLRLGCAFVDLLQRDHGQIPRNVDANPCSLNNMVVRDAYQEKGNLDIEEFVAQGSENCTCTGESGSSRNSLQVTTGHTILIAVPIYDRVLVPIARKHSGHRSGITTLQRMGVGILYSILTMVMAALEERKRLSFAKLYGVLDRPKSTVPMKVWWLLPQYMLCGLSDVFTVVGMQELFYEQMPESMRSLGAAVYLSIVGVGSFLSSGIISLVQVQVISLRRGGHEWLGGENLNRAHLDYFYWVLGGLSCLSLFFYVWVAKGFVDKKVEWNDDGKLYCKNLLCFYVWVAKGFVYF